LAVAELELLPRVKWDAGFGAVWQPGEAGAAQRLKQFAARAMDAYDDARNLPDRDGTSQLSPWLHFVELSPRQVWAAVAARSKDTGVFPPSNGARVFLSEIGWREFAHHLLFHFPHTPEQPLRAVVERHLWAVAARELPPRVTELGWRRRERCRTGATNACALRCARPAC
jgi:deoxyribodipyrimidine photo-lyase